MIRYFFWCVCSERSSAIWRLEGSRVSPESTAITATIDVFVAISHRSLAIAGCAGALVAALLMVTGCGCRGASSRAAAVAAHYCCHLRNWQAASSSFISCVAIVSSLLQCRAPTRSACALSTSTACVLCRQRLLGRVQRYPCRRPCFMPCGSAGGVFVSGTILLKSIVDARCDGERSNKRCTRAAAAACARAPRARECACVCVHFAGRFGTRRGG